MPPRGQVICKHKIQVENMIPCNVNIDVNDLVPFGKLYIWDISQNETLRGFFGYVVNTMTIEHYSRLLSIFEIPYISGNSIMQFNILNDLEIKVRIQREATQNKIKKIDEEIMICRLSIMGNWTVKKISEYIGCSEYHVQNIISSFARNGRATLIYFEHLKYTRKICLLDSALSMLPEFAKCYTERTLLDIYKDLESNLDFSRIFRTNVLKSF